MTTKQTENSDENVTISEVEQFEIRMYLSNLNLNYGVGVIALL